MKREGGGGKGSGYSSNNAMKPLTKKLPRAELKMAPASFPPTALVRMTAEETGGGIQPTT